MWKDRFDSRSSAKAIHPGRSVKSSLTGHTKALRKTAPIPKEFGVGDLVCFKTDQLAWSTAARIIGFDGPKVCWVLHKGTPACVATDRLRPLNESEALAYQYLYRQKPFEFKLGRQQQGYVDYRLEPVAEEDEEVVDDDDDDDGMIPGDEGMRPARDDREGSEIGPRSTGEPELE